MPRAPVDNDGPVAQKHHRDRRNGAFRESLRPGELLGSGAGLISGENEERLAVEGAEHLRRVRVVFELMQAFA